MNAAGHIVAPSAKEGGGAERDGTLLSNGLVLMAFSYVLLRISAEPLGANHDAAAHLMAGQLLLEGRRPYLDLYDLNPPLILYLYQIPAWISAHVGLHVIPVFLLLLTALAALSAWLLRRVLLDSQVTSRLTAHVLVLAHVLFTVLRFHEPTSFFGSREYLFCLAYLPFLGLRWASWEGRPVGRGLALTIGILAAVGACLKPHFVLIAFVPEIVAAVRTRRLAPFLRPEAVAYASTGALYALHFVLLPREMLDAMFGHIFPLVAKAYAVYDAPMQVVLGNPLLREALYGILAAGVIAFRARRAEATYGAMLAGLGIAAVASFLQQHKGWGYQVLPAHAAGLQACGVVAALLLQAEALSGFRARCVPHLRQVAGLLFALGVLPLAIGAVLNTVTAARQGLQPATFTQLHAILADQTRVKDPVMFVSTNVFPQYPTMTQMERRPGSRHYAGMMPIAFFYRGVRPVEGQPFPYHRPSEMGVEERTFIGEIESDVKVYAPKLIFIPAGGDQACPPGFRMMEYLHAAGFLEAIQPNYVLFARVSGYIVLKRSPTAIPAPPAAPAVP